MNILDNRTQLVVNNNTLSEQVLSMVRDLPEQQKAEGEYVWKKYDAPHYTISWAVTNSASPYTLVASCSEVDLTKVDASWFVGIHGVWNGTGYYEFPDINTLRIFDGNNIYNFVSTYNPSTKTFTVTSATGIGNTSQFADYVADGQFVDYVVDNDSVKYPDGDEQDGYWYVKYNPSPQFEIVDIKFSATNLTSCTINHSFGDNAVAVFATLANVTGTSTSKTVAGYTLGFAAIKDGYKFEHYMSGGSYQVTRTNYPTVEFASGQINVSGLNLLLFDSDVGYRCIVVGSTAGTVTSDEPVTITFTIQDVGTCQAEEGMTWNEWLISSYNTVGASMEGNYVTTSQGYVINESGTDYELRTATIKAGHTYICGI